MRGSLKERSPGHWAIILDINDPQTGARRRKWHAFRGNKRQAQAYCAKLITEMKRRRLRRNRQNVAERFPRQVGARLGGRECQSKNG
jgi:hypothetical protein